MNLTIREATTADALLIADISRQSFYDTFAEQNTKADMDKFLKEQFIRANLIMEVGQPENQFFIAYSGDEVAGYIKLRDARKPAVLAQYRTLEVARLYAMKPMIGKGVGALLMQTAIQQAEKKLKEILWLGVWERNTRAIEFYTRWGFQKFEETDFILGDDVQRDWLMQKEIATHI